MFSLSLYLIHIFIYSSIGCQTKTHRAHLCAAAAGMATAAAAAAVESNLWTFGRHDFGDDYRTHTQARAHSTGRGPSIRWMEWILLCSSTGFTVRHNKIWAIIRGKIRIIHQIVFAFCIWSFLSLEFIWCMMMMPRKELECVCTQAHLSRHPVTVSLSLFLFHSLLLSSDRNHSIVCVRVFVRFFMRARELGCLGRLL